MGYKNKPNNDYFQKIDSEYKAYILGFIYADGSIVQPKGNRQMKLSISIQEEDGYILEKFAKDAGNTKVDIFYPPSVQKKNWKKRAVVSIVSNQICQDLINFGCIINKSSLGMSFPNIEEKYYSHFIRGFLDGDGCIYIKKIAYNYQRKTQNIRKDTHIQRYCLKIAFTSTDNNFLTKIMEILKVEKVYIAEKLRKQLVYTFWIEREKDSRNVINFLYKDANYFLNRKWSKILEFNKAISSQAIDKSIEGSETT